MKELPHTRSCFVCGEANPAGLKLRFETDGRIVRARFTPGPGHIGFKGVIHGGLIATVLDEIMVWACAAATRQFAYCAEMNVRFLKPLAPGETAIVTGEMVLNRKGRIFEAKSAFRTEADTIIAEGTGKYLPIKPATVAEMTGDFIGDSAWLSGGSPGPAT